MAKMINNMIPYDKVLKQLHNLSRGYMAGTRCLKELTTRER
jgi:hypothetical protein